METLVRPESGVKFRVGGTPGGCGRGDSHGEALPGGP